MKRTLTLEEQPNPEDVAIVRQGLYEYNLPYADDNNYKELTIFLRDETDAVIGGLLGATYWGYLNIEILWIKEDHRNQGHGQRLLNAAEKEAMKRGCRYAHLDTHSFQALSFYQNYGYKVAGELEDLPPGYSRYLLRKVLSTTL